MLVEERDHPLRLAPVHLGDRAQQRHPLAGPLAVCDQRLQVLGQAAAAEPAPGPQERGQLRHVTAALACRHRQILARVDAPHHLRHIDATQGGA